MKKENVPTLAQRKPILEWIEQLRQLEEDGMFSTKEIIPIMEISSHQLATIRKLLRNKQAEEGLAVDKTKRRESIEKNSRIGSRGKWGELGSGTNSQRCSVWNGKLPPTTDADREEMRADRAGVAVGLERTESPFTSDFGVCR